MVKLILVREDDARALLERIWNDAITIGGLTHDEWMAREIDEITIETIDKGE